MQTVTARKIPLVALLSANTISLVGNQLTYIAIPWFVLQTTGSAAKTGIAAFFTALPALLAAFFGGPLVDRWGYKRTGVVADLASGLTVALVPLLYHTVGLAFWQLLALTFLGALLDTPGGTARDSLIPDLATLAGVRLERVNAIGQTLWRVAGLFGPPLAGLLIALLGPSNVLFLDAASFAISAALVARIVPRSSAATSTVVPGETRSYLAELRAGLDFIRGDRLLATLIVSFTLLNALGEPLFGVVLPVYARHIYGSAVDLGFMLAAFAGGGLLGTALFGVWGHRLSRRSLYIGGFLLASLALWPLLALPPLPVLLGILALRGLAGAPLNLLAVTVAQERIPAQMRGRVFGVGRAFALAAAPLSLVLVGSLLEISGIRSTLAVLATVQLILTLALVRAAPLRQMDRPARGREGLF